MWYQTRKLAGVLMVFTLFCATSSANAQEDIFRLGMQLGVGSRAIAMGGAYVSLGGDYASSWWNPAGLRDVRRSELYGTGSYTRRKNEFGLIEDRQFFSPADYMSEANFTRFENVGLAYAVPTYQGSMVVSFGYNRIKSFDSNFEFQTYNQTEDDQLNQAWREGEKGGLNAWILAGALDVSPNMSLGLGLNLWTGGSTFQSTFREYDIDDRYTFDEFTIDDGLKTDITGFNAKFGVLMRMGILRLGGTIASPLNLKIKEDWTYADRLIFDDLSASDSTDSGYWEYKLKSPFSASAGASLNLLNFIFSGDVEYNDWTNTEYKATLVEDDSEIETNRIIKDNYRATTRIRLGGEFTLPMTGLSFRLGYFLDPSIFKDAREDEDKQFYSAGVGFLVDKSVRLDATYVRGEWKSYGNGLSNTVDVGDYVEDITTDQIYVSLAFRL